jgi:hypothetical protein
MKMLIVFGSCISGDRFANSSGQIAVGPVSGMKSDWRRRHGHSIGWIGDGVRRETGTRAYVCMPPAAGGSTFRVPLTSLTKLNVLFRRQGISREVKFQDVLA